MTRDGWLLRFTGREATGPLLDAVLDEIERMFGPGVRLGTSWRQALVQCPRIQGQGAALRQLRAVSATRAENRRRS
jgi:hypothetical protein